MKVRINPETHNNEATPSEAPVQDTRYFPSWVIQTNSMGTLPNVPQPASSQPVPQEPDLQDPAPQYYDAGICNFAGYQNMVIATNNAMQTHAFMTNYDASVRLQEAKIRAEIKVVEEQQKLQARLEYNERRKENDLIRTLKVFMGPGNVPMVESMLRGERHGTCVEIVSVNGYKSKIYASTGKDQGSVLEVTWDNCNEPIRIVLGKDLVANEKLLIGMLKEKGVQVVCPRGIRKAALEGLYSETIRTASLTRIPYRHGWNLLKDGKLHYVYKNEITMQEVSRNARRYK